MRLSSVLCGLSSLAFATALSASDFQFAPLVSNTPGEARFLDNQLVFTWSIATQSSGMIWAANAGTGIVSQYNSSGEPVPAGAPLVLTVPPAANAAAGTLGSPMGLAVNTSNDFVITNGSVSAPSTLLIATSDGTICAWNPLVDAARAVRVADNFMAGARYESLAIGSNARGNFIFAANFPGRRIDIFDKNFAAVTWDGAFVDPGLPAEFSPLSVHALSGVILVCYARQSPADVFAEVPGPGNGIISVFDGNGTFLRRLVSNGVLNSPLGMALAPKNFGQFSNVLIVGNCSDGQINMFDLETGTFLGQLSPFKDTDPAFAGVRGLLFGPGDKPDGAVSLFVSGGTGAGGSRGLLGKIDAVNAKPVIVSSASASPSNPVTGQTVTFMVAAADADTPPVSYSWTFGDGGTGIGATVTHSYSSAGVFLATATATDGGGLSTSSAVSVSVGAAGDWVIKKMKLTLDFVRSGKDALQISGTLALPEGFTPDGQTVSVTVAGETRSFLLNSKGASPRGLETFQLRMGKGKPAQYTLKLAGATLTDLRSNMGLTDEAVKNKPVAIPVMLGVGGMFYLKTQSQLYSVSKSRKGSTK